MTRSIYVLATEGQTAKSVVGLGIVEGLTREVEKVGVFRPIIKGGPKRDGVLDALTSLPAVRQRYSDAVGVTYEEVRNDPDGALTQIVNKFNAVKDQFDAVVIVGSDYSDVMASTELAYNAKIAANLSSPVCLAVSSRNREPNEVLNLARNALAECAKQHAKAIAVIATRVPGDERCDEYADALTAIPDVFTGAIPAHPLLAAPSLEQQLSAVGAKVITGRREQLQRESQGVLLASMTLPNVLERLFTEATVIVPADRAELIPGILMAHTSGSFPQLTGMILVGGDEIPAPIQSLMSSVHHELPIAACNRSSYETAERLFRIEGIMTSSPRKVELARRLFNERIDITALMEKMKLAPSDIVTPLMFESKLNEMARKNKRTIVLPESGDDRILEAAAIVLDRGTAGIILLGDATTIKTRATQLGLSLDGAEIVDPTDEDLIERFASEYARLRAHKGVTLEEAKKRFEDVSYVGTMMVHMGMAHGMVSGAVNTTANTIRPSLEFVKTKPGVKVVSSSFLMCMPDRVDVYGDCAVNPNPTAEELADIAIGSAETAAAFGIEPRVAMLSYSTGTSGAGADVEKVAAATELVRARNPKLKVDGPIQFDAAMDFAVGQKKLPGSEVAGKATVYIFPDLNTGNNTYKAVQRTAGAVAIGPVLQGLNKPVNDLSRGALVEDIVNTIAITAIQAQHS